MEVFFCPVLGAYDSLMTRTANNMQVSYTRPQQGHSLMKHILLTCVGVGCFTLPYYSFSPNHYWHF